MGTSKASELVHVIGNKIVSDPAYLDQPWDGVSLVGTFSEGQRRMTGFRFFADGAFKASLPKDKDLGIMNGLRDLHREMSAETGAAWHQCLIQIWKPGPKIHIDFEYDDPERWKLKPVSLDVSDYANSIRPPMD